VSNSWFLLSIGQIAIRVCDSSLPVCARWSGLLLFLLGQKHWLVSSSPSKVCQFSFVCCPQSNKISSAICHATTLEGWLIAPLLLSVFLSHPALVFIVWLLVPPQFLEAGSVFHPTPTICSRLLFIIYVFSVLFWVEGCNLPMRYTW
jgi:hypothetical protein